MTGSRADGFHLLQSVFMLIDWHDTLQFEASFDGGTTWAPISGATVGTTATFTAPTQFVAVEPERGVLWRVNCTAYTSGTANVRLSA